jgi:hypothetical protein
MTHLTSSSYISVPWCNTLRLFPTLSKLSLIRVILNSCCLISVHLVVMREAAVSFCHMASQQELSSILPLPPCFLHNLKFWLADCSDCHLLSHWYLIRLIFQPWTWRLHVPPKLQLTFNGQHGIMSHCCENLKILHIYLYLCTVILLYLPQHLQTWHPLTANHLQHASGRLILLCVHISYFYIKSAKINNCFWTWL